MRRASFLLPAAFVGLLVFGAIGVWAYDASRDDLIADGVSVGGVDVGGMRAGAARAELHEQVAEPLQRAVRVKAGGQGFKLSARRAGVEIDVDGMVDEALQRSREGNVVSRTVRDLTGGSEPAELPSRVSWSERAVAELVRDVEDRVERPARDASVEPSPSGLQTVRGQNGRELQAGQLERAVGAQLELPHGERVVKGRTDVVEPEVTSDELASEYPYYITIDRGSKQLRFFKRLELEKTYSIAVGRVGFETPAGLYHVQNKAVNVAWQVPEWGGKLAGKTIPGGAPNNPLKARWLGIYDGAGIHGTDDVASLGTAASHGCIRMAIPDVIELYDQVPVQTPIYIG